MTHSAQWLVSVPPGSRRCMYIALCVFSLASGVFVSAMLMVLMLEGYLPANIGHLPVVGTYA